MWRHILNDAKVCLPFDLILSLDPVQLLIQIISPYLRQEDSDFYVCEDQKSE